MTNPMTTQMTPQANHVNQTQRESGNDEPLDLAGKHLVLGLSGGIACYKAAELCRALIKAGGFGHDHLYRRTGLDQCTA